MPVQLESLKDDNTVNPRKGSLAPSGVTIPSGSVMACARLRTMGTMPRHPRIACDPAVMLGKPVIRGTRVPVSVVVGSLAAGMTPADIEREYELTAEDIIDITAYLASLPVDGAPPATMTLTQR